MSLIRGVAAIGRGMRQIATSPAVRDNQPLNPGYKKIKPLQDFYLIEDGKPIHLKRGATDYFLYVTTMGLCVGALGWDLYLYYQLAQT